MAQKSTPESLIAQAQRTHDSLAQAQRDMNELRRQIVALDRTENSPSRNEIARIVEKALSRRLVLGTLKGADLMDELAPLIGGNVHSPSDGLDCFKGLWHLQVLKDGQVRVSLVPSPIAADDKLDSEHDRVRAARRVLSKIEDKDGYTVKVKGDRDPDDELANWGSVIISKL